MSIDTGAVQIRLHVKGHDEWVTTHDPPLVGENLERFGYRDWFFESFGSDSRGLIYRCESEAFRPPEGEDVGDFDEADFTTQ